MPRPRLITRALTIVRNMGATKHRRGGGRWRINGYWFGEKRHRELERILVDLDARQSVVQPSRRKAHGLKASRKPAR